MAGIVAALEAGTLKAAVVVEGEIASWTPRARQALEKLEFLVVLDYLAGPLADRAHVFFPTTAAYESDGMVVNRAGRLQCFARMRVPGLSVIEQIEHASFPRGFRETPPEGDARMAWSALDSLRQQLPGAPAARSLPHLREELKASHPLWRPLRQALAGGEGMMLDATALAPAMPAVPAFDPAPGLSLFRMERALGSETLSRRSPAMQKMAGPPVALLSPADAPGLGGRGRVTLDVGGQSVEMAARADAGVPAGVIIVPRDVEWPIGPRQGAAVKVTAVTAGEAAR